MILESYAKVYSNQFTTGNNPFQLGQCSTVPNNKKLQILNYSSHARQPLSRVNVTGDVFKTWLCPNVLLLPQKTELPKIWGGCSPPRPPPFPGRTPMFAVYKYFFYNNTNRRSLLKIEFDICNGKESLNVLNKICLFESCTFL